MAELEKEREEENACGCGGRGTQGLPRATSDPPPLQNFLVSVLEMEAAPILINNLLSHFISHYVPSLFVARGLRRAFPVSLDFCKMGFPKIGAFLWSPFLKLGFHSKPRPLNPSIYTFRISFLASPPAVAISFFIIFWKNLSVIVP